MQHTIEQVAGVGGAIRVARPVQQKSRQNAAAGRLGVSESLMVEAERGANTVQ
ncbi:MULTISPECIES: hypothetical protein [Burkholderia]|uniref:hypothetical protein n=1 Tax=Burkholderia TaxID=32008 RepID=UPI0004039851|nr:MULTISPECIES: hypothetical protein [Burkholderia]